MAGRSVAAKLTSSRAARGAMEVKSVPKFVVERELPDAGVLTPSQLVDLSRRSQRVLEELGPTIQWVESYVTDDRIYCTYIAPNAEIIREHARRGGFPANRISPVHAVIDPTTAGA
jgi:hypothetical protein